MGKCGALLGALGLALLLVSPRALVWAKKDAKRDARIELIRGLAQEVGVSKVALPRGKKGIVLDAQGQLDKEKSTWTSRCCPIFQNGPLLTLMSERNISLSGTWQAM